VGWGDWSRLVPVASSSASDVEGEAGNGAVDERRSISTSSPRTHGYGAIVASAPAAAESRSPELVSSTRSVPAVTGTLEPESSLRTGASWSAISGSSRRFLHAVVA